MEINNDEYYDEEEFLVYADFETLLVPDELYDDDTKINIIGIETENPIIQINRKIFKGTYDFVPGTNLFFNQNLNKINKCDDMYDKNPEKTYNYITKTDKLLKMKRIFVKTIDDDIKSIAGTSFEDDSIEENQPGCSKTINKPDCKTYLINKTYEEALNQFKKHGDNNELINKYLRNDMEALMCKDKQNKTFIKMSKEGSDSDRDVATDYDDDKDMDYIPTHS